MEERLSWRDRARPVVAEIVRRVGFKDPRALRQALFEAYPFGERARWPYRAWLAEVREQIGGMRPRKPDPAQMDLFEELQMSGEDQSKIGDGEQVAPEIQRIADALKGVTEDIARRRAQQQDWDAAVAKAIKVRRTGAVCIPFPSKANSTQSNALED